VKQIQPIYYNLKNNNETFKNRHIGFSAQELQKQFPEIVTEKDGNLIARYDNMTAVLLQAIKEQQQQIEVLKKEKQDQKEINNQLLQRIEIIEAAIKK
jgi:hypothetical protein